MIVIFTFNYMQLHKILNELRVAEGNVVASILLPTPVPAMFAAFTMNLQKISKNQPMSCIARWYSVQTDI